MSEIKQINTGVAELLAVKVPEGAKSIDEDIFINKYGSHIRWWTQQGHDELIDLPLGYWTPLGLSTELTEEQCSGVVESVIFGMDASKSYDGYTDYTKCQAAWETAKKSFASLMQANGCFTENPMGEKPDIETYLSGRQHAHFFRLWEKDEANTGTWLVLKRL